MLRVLLNFRSVTVVVVFVFAVVIVAAAAVVAVVAVVAAAVVAAVVVAAAVVAAAVAAIATTVVFFVLVVFAVLAGDECCSQPFERMRFKTFGSGIVADQRPNFTGFANGRQKDVVTLFQHFGMAVFSNPFI
tara:strand:- start:184 stop:579 length:396 start_codon:yes stop_codon:yes gene_type:complete